MIQTGRQALRLLQRPRFHQLRGYADTRPPDHTESSRGTDPYAGNDPSDKHDSTGKPSEHAASAGHVESTHHNPHPAPENEPIPRGVYIAVAVLFGSLAFYKYSRTDSPSGEVSNQPWLTRVLHYFDYHGEQNTIRNELFTAMIQQAGHDKSLFDGAPPSTHVELTSAEVFFNSGSPWNVPAGSSANLEHLHEHYRKQNIEVEQQRKERVERMARRAAAVGKSETEKIKEAFGWATNAISQVRGKASKGD